MKKQKVLIVDDDAQLRRTLEGQLSLLGFEAISAADGAEAETCLQSGRYNLVLLDLKLPDTDGLILLKRWKEQQPQLPIIMMSGQSTLNALVEAMKHQAADFLMKPVDVRLLQAVINRTLEVQALSQENQRLRQVIHTEEPLFLGKNPAVLTLLETANRVAPSDHPVLLEGETGTGKQILARHLHAASDRSTELFVALNCAAITQSLFESELFGHEKGAFTGAYVRKAGKLELVGGGTLFLDEIGELPLACQAKLLTVVEDRTFERVGGTHPLTFKGRIIAATNRDLDAEIKNGNFRRDLFYRLSTFRFKLPALREHSDDLPIYIASALAFCRRKYGRSYDMPDPETLRHMAGYPWPGNVRELKHHVERIALLSTASQISPNLWLSFPIEARGEPGPLGSDLAEVLSQCRKRHVLEILKQCGGNQTEAARKLNIGRTYLNRLLAKYQEEDHEALKR
jgi:DNA-binding NtrC family response regulator